MDKKKHLIKRHKLQNLYARSNQFTIKREVCLSEDVEKLEEHFYRDEKAYERMVKLNKQMQEIINWIKAQTKKG